MRALVLVLGASIATGGSLPWLTRQLAGPPIHVCHCSTHYECLCALCHTDRPELGVSEQTIKGRCGDDEASFAGKAFRAVVARPIGLPVATSEVAARTESPPPLASAPRRAPPTPPPRG